MEVGADRGQKQASQLGPGEELGGRADVEVADGLGKDVVRLLVERAQRIEIVAREQALEEILLEQALGRQPVGRPRSRHEQVNAIEAIVPEESADGLVRGETTPAMSEERARPIEIRSYRVGEGGHKRIEARDGRLVDAARATGRLE